MISYASRKSARQLFCALATLLLSISAQTIMAQGLARPKLVIDSLQIELDTLYQTDSVKVIDIPFRNEGDADLTFTEVAPDCPCLHIDFDTKKAYPPHSEGKIRITFDLSVPPQEIDKGIYIYSNATRYDESIDVRFHGWLLMTREK